MKSTQVLLTVTFCLITILNLTLAIDNTLVEKKVGREIVEAVVEKIRSSAIFDEDYEFLRRVAYVESRDGESNKTFLPEGYYGGIWQVSERFFDASQDTSLSSFHQNISSIFKINWMNVTWRDLLKPLYSGLAARLYIQSKGEDIPQTKDEQSKFWDRHYNHKDEYNETTFYDAIDELDNSTATCSGKMDLVIVLDGSSSVNENNPNNFQTCLSFVTALLGTYSLEYVRSGFIVYSRKSEPIFELNNNYTFADLATIVAGTEYPNDRTDTNGAILAALDMFNRSTPRNGVPQVFTILTDGESTSPGVSNIKFLKEAGISSYVIGITDDVNLDELNQLAYNINSNVFPINNFEVLTEFFKRLNSETCKIPQKPEMDTPVQDSVNQNEKRFYSFTIPTVGMTISIDNEEGETTGYYSYDEPNPTSAIHDGVLFYAGTFIEPRKRDAQVNQTIYVSIEGLESVNKYGLEAITGYAVGQTTTELPTTEDQTTEDPSQTTEDPSQTTEDPTQTSNNPITDKPTTESFAHHMQASIFTIFISSLIMIVNTVHLI